MVIIDCKKIISVVINLGLIIVCFVCFLSFLVKTVLPDSIHIKDIKKNSEVASSEIFGKDNVKTNKDYGVNIEEPINNVIKVYSNKKKALKEMDLEEYVKGVVASEMPALFEIEALKAQAIAARTFAINHMSSNGGKPCHTAQKYGGDICDATHCQVYRDKGHTMDKWEKDNANEYWKRIKLAVESTKGEIIKYNNKIIDMPLYFAVSSGNTENIKDVFNEERPYLISVTSYGDNIAPKYVETSKISKEKFIEELRLNNISINKEKMDTSISIIEKNNSGSISKIKLGDKVIHSVDFRKMFSLNSTNMTIKITEENVEITCKGYGHGVGMSQWGANAMASEGKTYNEIIEHYYSGVEVQKIKYR